MPDLQHLQNSLNVENRKASSLLFIVLVLDAGLSEPKIRHSETKRKRSGHLALALALALYIKAEIQENI